MVDSQKQSLRLKIDAAVKDFVESGKLEMLKQYIPAYDHSYDSEKFLEDADGVFERGTPVDKLIFWIEKIHEDPVDRKADIDSFAIKHNIDLLGDEIADLNYVADSFNFLYEKEVSKSTIEL